MEAVSLEESKEGGKAGKGKGKGKVVEVAQLKGKLLLKFKKFVFDVDRKAVTQDGVTVSTQ